MMLVDHIASSIILSNSNRTIRNKSILWIICIFSSIAPDILAFFYHPGSIEYLSHRSYTNSVIIAPIYALAIAFIFKLISLRNQIPFYIYFLVSLVSYYLHIFLDFITPYGSPLFFPFTNKQYGLDIIHSFDLVFLTISTTLILISIFSIFKRIKLFSRIVRLSFYVYLFYISFMLLYKSLTYSNYKNYLSANYPNSKYEKTIPRTFWRWRGIALEKNKIIQLNGTFKVSQVKEINSIDNLPDFIRLDEYFKKFILYARYPAAEINKKRISVFNAIYSDQSYRLTYEIEGDSIISKSISGFDLIDK